MTEREKRDRHEERNEESEVNQKDGWSEGEVEIRAGRE